MKMENGVYQMLVNRQVVDDFHNKNSSYDSIFASRFILSKHLAYRDMDNHCYQVKFAFPKGKPKVFLLSIS